MPTGSRSARRSPCPGSQASTTTSNASILAKVADGSIDVRTDWRASPTGFPFKVVNVEGTLSDERVYRDRRRVCDLGLLRVPYRTSDGAMGYRCPAEPVRAYSEIKGGREANTDARVCLCNGLLATAGLAQHRNSGYVEPPVVTGGADYRAVAELITHAPPDGEFYTAGDVIHYLTQHV